MYDKCTKVNEMLRWDFDKCVGSVFEYVDDEKDIEKAHKYKLYQGNAFLIALAEWEEDEKELWCMHWFFADKEHMKNCLGVGKYKDKSTIFDHLKEVSFVFNEKMSKADMKQLANALIQSDLKFNVTRL